MALLMLSMPCLGLQSGGTRCTAALGDLTSIYTCNVARGLVR